MVTLLNYKRKTKMLNILIIQQKGKLPTLKLSRIICLAFRVLGELLIYKNAT